MIMYKHILLGSVTLKVLHHCKVPVLVHKPARERTHVGEGE